jgi:hypothetical protein
VTGLTPNTTYTFTVTAAGKAAPAVNASTPAVPVSALAANVVSSTAIDLTWTNTNGGGALATLVVSPAGGVVAYTAGGASVTGLIPSTTYSFTVTVAGQVATVGSVTTALAAATNVSATNVATLNGQCASANGCGVNVAWNNSNGPLTSVVIARNDGLWSTTLTGAQITALGSVVDTTAQANTTYTYTVTVNAGAYSQVATSITPVTTLPYMPAASMISATLQPDGTTVVLTYTDNAYGETQYSISMNWVSVTGKSSTPISLVAGSGGVYTTTISNLVLTAGSTYDFRVVPYSNIAKVYGDVSTPISVVP